MKTYLKIVSSVLIASLAAALAGCERKVASTAKSGGELKIVRVLAAQIGYEPLYLGKAEGIFEGHGIDLRITIGAVTAAESIPQALSGQYEVVTTSILPLTQAVVSGLGIKAVASGMRDYSNDQSIEGLLVPPGSTVRSIADLKGRTVAFGGLGTVPQLAVLKLARDAGLSPGDIKQVSIPYNGMVQAARNGSVDAVDIFDSFRAAALKAGFREIAQPVRQVFPNSPWLLYAMSDRYLSDNSEVARAFAAALGQASQFANANPEKVRSVAAQHSKLAPDLIKTRDLPVFHATIDVPSLEAQLRAAHEFGFIDKVPKTNQVIMQFGSK